VGAGPAGVSAALRLLEAGLQVLLVDREGFGGTILHYPRAKVVMTGNLELALYGGVCRRTMSKEDLVELWADIQTRINPPFVTGELVTGLARLPNGNWAVQSDRARREAANVVRAVGGRGSPRKLGVPGEELGKVSYRLLEPDPFVGRHVLVVGGGNSAVESALALSDDGRCASVSISYRKSQFARCRAENQTRIAQAIAQGRVQPLFSSAVERIEPALVTLATAREQRQRLPNDATIVQIGGTPPAELLKSFGIQLVSKYGER
jgi:thioredoxin reductase